MISPKQKKILAFPYSRYDALICDGAVRSGKTSVWNLRKDCQKRRRKHDHPVPIHALRKETVYAPLEKF